MQRLTIQVGSFEVNCSILSRDGGAWIVDPGGEAGRIIDLIGKHGLEPEAILLTHAHFDHIGGIPGLLEAYPSLPVYVGAKDVEMIGHPLNQMQPDYPPIGRPGVVRDAHSLAGVEVIDTPGHTPGGVCYYFAEDGLLLSGDTLFAGSVGRTDFPGGSMVTLMESLERLTTLPGETLVIPGHGPHTTIERERSGNPFIR